MNPLSIVTGFLSLGMDIWQAAEEARRQGMAEDVMRGALSNAYGIDIADLDQMFIAKEQAEGRPDVQASDQRSAELDALRQMSEMGAKGGMDEGSIAALQQAGARTAQQNQQARQSIGNQMQQRGQWGSGNELASQLSAAQSSANALSLAGTQAAGDARQRALQAIAASGGMASRARGADEQLALANKEAAEARDRFNTTIRHQANQFNSQAHDRRAGMQTARAGQVTGAAGKYSDVLTSKDKESNRTMDDAQSSLDQMGNEFTKGFGGGKK